MRNAAKALIVLFVLSAAVAPLWAIPGAKRKLPPKAGGKDKGRLMIVAAEGYKIALDEMEARAKVELAELGSREYSLRIKGRVAAPKTEDAVAFTKRPEVLRVLDSEKRNLLQHRAPARTGGFGGGSGRVKLNTYRPDTFTPLHDRKAEIEVPETKLTRDAYTIDVVELGATAILAEKRNTKQLRAIVMEESVELVGDLRIRVMALRLSDQRAFTVVADCSRPHAGPVGPFVEGVAVLDENEEVLATGRWTRGDPFGQKVTLTAEVTVPPDRVHKYLRFIVCTEYSKKPLKFLVRNLIRR